MSEYSKKVQEFASRSKAIVLITRTILPQMEKAMQLAGEKANKYKIPIVLDPVGIGATSYRKEFILGLLITIDITVIKGNAGEIATLAGIEWETKGVDAGAGEADLIESAKVVARKYNCLVGLTGPVDIITDGSITYLVKNRHTMMGQIKESGCMLSGLLAVSLRVRKFHLKY